MHIEITGETEQLIKTALASGQYASAEDFITAMAQAYLSTEVSRQPQPLRTHVDVDTLAREQGIEPVKDMRDLKGSFWDEGESVDAFIHDIQMLRQHDVPRVR